jgi:hypothetical protein
MKTLLQLFAMAGIAAAGCAHAVPPATETLMHTQTGFDLVVHLPYNQTTPLFGPEGERAWASPHWDPRFIYPKPARDAQGAVFTVRHGPFDAVWVNTLFDVDARHFQYVYFIPDIMVTVIDVRFKSVSADATAVNVLYTRTAITTQGNEHVTAMGEGDKTAGKDWQQAIDAYLASVANRQ